MEQFHDYMAEYRKQLEKGAIQKAYKGLIDYILGLKTYLQKKYPDYSVSSSLYFGYMDMTYFSFTPASLQNRKLKIAIVFVYDTFRFEAWLCGANRQVQSEYWKLLKTTGWTQYHIVPSIKGIDSIVEHVLVEEPNFRDLDVLTSRIERGALKFIADVEGFLAAHSL